MHIHTCLRPWLSEKIVARQCKLVTELVFADRCVPDRRRAHRNRLSHYHKQKWIDEWRQARCQAQSVRLRQLRPAGVVADDAVTETP